MEDPKILFADTTARRAQLMAATERLKHSISDGVESIKEDATEVSKTAAFVAGTALAVYLVVNTILPKSDEYRYAEKYGEPDEVEDDDEDYEDDDDNTRSLAVSSPKKSKKQAKKIKKSAAVSGLVGGLVTTILTNIAREQLTGFLARIRTNNAINPTAEPTEYHEKAPTQPVDYTP